MTDELIQGLEDFKRYQYGDDNALMPTLVEDGQSPKYFIITCIDSRTNPGTIFRAPPGTFFSHKAMGAIVRPYKQGTALAAALQFALKYNKVETIIVLGHTGCGAIKALVENMQDEEISSFVNIAKHALDKAEKTYTTPQDITDHTKQEVVLQSVENLKNYPSVKAALSKKSIQIKPWLFDMKNGNLLEYNDAQKDFVTINTDINKSDSRQI